MVSTRFLKSGLLATSFLLSPAAALADQPDSAIQLNEVTVTATRIPTPVTRVAAGVTIITSQEMQQRGYTTLAQALTAVPGVNLVQSGGPGGQTSVFMRGTNSEDVLVLMDGVPVNDPSDPNGAFDFGQDTLAGIDRIEVIRGPLSSLYGSSAIGGVINIISVQGSGKPKAEIVVAGGYPAQGQGSATISGESGKFDYALSGAIGEEAGFDATARRLSVYANHPEPFRNKSGLLNLGYSPVAGTRVYLILRARKTDSAYPDLGYPIYDDPNETSHETSWFGKLGVKSAVTKNFTTEFFLARSADDRYYSNLLDADDPNFATANDHYHGLRNDMQWNNTLTLPRFSIASSNAVQFGVEYIEDHAKEDVDEYEDSFTEGLSNKFSQHSWSGHIGGQTTLYNRFTITGALRDDTVSSFGSAVTGRIGGVMAIPEAYMRLKASYGTGFLAPSLYDLYGTDNYGYQGNPNLKPERSGGFDAGAEFDLPYSSMLSVTYFSSHIKNLIVNVENDDFTASTEQNVGSAQIDGVEAELTLAPAPWISADLTYTYTNTNNADTDTQLLRRPHNSGSATLTITPVPKLSIVPSVQYIGPFSDYLYGNDGYPINSNGSSIGAAQPGTIVNLTVNYAVTPKFSIFAQGKNLTNSPFEPVNGLQIPGASMLIGVRATIQ